MARAAILTGGVLGLACFVSPVGATEPPDTQPTRQPITPAAATANSDPSTEDRRRQLLSLQTLMLELGFEAAYDEQSVRSASRDPLPRRTFRQTRRTLRLEETAGLQADGALFGEQSVQFNAAARWGLSQERHRQSGWGLDDSAAPHGQLLEYSADFTFFPRGRLSGSAFAERHTDRVPRTFLPSLDRSRERYGAGLYFSAAKLPMRITFEHSRDALDSRTRDARDDEQRGRDQLRYEATWQIDEQHSLRLAYDYDDRREEYAGSRTRFDTLRHHLTLNHTLRFGDRGRSSWENLLRLQDESGDLARDNAEAMSRLRLQHTDALATDCRVQFLRDSFQGLTTETWRAEAGVTHRLESWLTTTAQLYGLHQSAEQRANWAEWGGQISASAARENRWGRFSSNLSYNHASTDTRHGTRRGVVIGESVTFRDPLPTYLAHTDVDSATIVVVDEARTRTYLPGRDYVVSRAGHHTALRRVASGAIPDRATVLVSYTYRVAGDYDLRRDRVDFRMQQAFRGGLTPYYAASIQAENVDTPRRAAFAGRDVNRHRLGATYRRPRWSVGLEYEYNDDSLYPYQAVHTNGDVVLWQKPTHQLDGKAAASQYWFRELSDLMERDALICDLGRAYRPVLARYLNLDASALYRYEDDRLYGITHGVDLTGALEWRLGHFSLRFEVEYDLLNLPGSRDQAMSFWVKLKREIPVAGGKRS
jgi:hypothetical protein